MNPAENLAVKKDLTVINLREPYETFTILLIIYNAAENALLTLYFLLFSAFFISSSSLFLR